MELLERALIGFLLLFAIDGFLVPIVLKKLPLIGPIFFFRGSLIEALADVFSPFYLWIEQKSA